MSSVDTEQGRSWDVLLTGAAEADFQAIILWTTERFGAMQARVYSETLSSAIEALTAGPAILGARLRDDIARGIHTLHVARGGRRGRHFVMFQVAKSQAHPRIEVLRLLHDAMDLPSHLPPMDERE